MKLHYLLPLCFLIASAFLKAENSINEESVPTTLVGAVKDGKVELKLNRRISWTKEPCYPLKISLLDGKRVPVVTSTVENGTTVELCGFLSPGKYTIYSEVDKASGYWGSYGGTVSVAEDGRISIQPQPIQHSLKMKLIAPSQMELVVVARPTLLWEPVEGAKSYTIRWFEEEPATRKVLSQKQNIKVTDPGWAFDVDVVPLRTYEWQVDAYDEAGVRIAYFASGYFRTE